MKRYHSIDCDIPIDFIGLSMVDYWL